MWGQDFPVYGKLGYLIWVKNVLFIDYSWVHPKMMIVKPITSKSTRTLTIPFQIRTQTLKMGIVTDQVTEIHITVEGRGENEESGEKVRATRMKSLLKD